MVDRRLHRLLCRISIAASFLAGLAALFGGGAVERWPLAVVWDSPHNLLVLAVVSGLIAWALTLARTPEEMRLAPPSRKRTFVAVLVWMIVALNLLLLAQPSQPLPPFKPCQDELVIGRGFRHFLNCDSSEYLAIAREPWLVLTHGILQGRPLSFLVATVVSQPFRFVYRLSKAGPYRPYSREFVAYLLINLAVLTLALLCFTWTLEAGTGVPAGIELIVALVALSANDLTKLFFWTPHTQIFNLLVPCLSMYLSVRLLTRGEPMTPMRAFKTGLLLGLGPLIYGSFVIPALCIAAIHVLLFRRLWPAVLVCCGVLLPYVCWVALVYSLVGSFYNHEVGMYRQFVWMADCAKVSLASCIPVAKNNLLTFFDTAVPVVIVPLLFALGCRVARYAWPGEVDPPLPSSALGRAAALTFVMQALFLALMGRYAPRLCWSLVPPLLLVVALELQALRLSRPHARMRMLSVGTVVICTAYVVMLASRQGPYN